VLTSLRVRLFLVWLISLLACAALVPMLMQLYRLSDTAQQDRAEAELSRICDRMADRYAYYIAGWAGPAPLPGDVELAADLAVIARLALPPIQTITSGILRDPEGTDALSTLATESLSGASRLLDRQEEGGGTRLTQTCPLSGPIANLVGWASLTVPGAPGLGPMRQGMALLLALTLTLSGSLAWLARSWSRRIGRLTAEIAAHDGASLPRVSPTGASDVDQVVAALNQASARLEAALEEARTQSARAAAAERLAALGRVAAGVAHEIRNPIAAMRLRAESGLAGDDTRRRGALGAILGQIDRLDRLSAELLAVTQRRAPELQDVDLAAFLAAIIRDHAAPHLNFNIAAAGTARFDPAMIRRALDNLVLNASRYLAQGGTISLSASRITGRLLMTVADTGPGVDPALRDRLFEPFVTSRSDGTGLGLAIAREMVQAHGGTITLAPGSGGAVFTIEIPQP